VPRRSAVKSVTTNGVQTHTTGFLCPNHGATYECAESPECAHRDCATIRRGQCPACEDAARVLHTHDAGDAA
jgi:hypothetical protein